MNTIRYGKGRINTGFTKIINHELVILASGIHHGISTSEYFNDPVPKMKDFKEVIGNFASSLSAKDRQTPVGRATKHILRADLIDYLKKLGSYVTLVADGNLTILTASNFIISKPKNVKVKLTSPGPLKIKDGGNDGELIIKVPCVDGAKCYNFQYTSEKPSSNTSWTTITLSASRCHLKGLQSEKRHWCRVGVVGSRSLIIYSDIFSRVVQ